ncbi:pilus assembly protein CpaE [Aliishimia ponticola]|uniref:Pilus assembly protein CpaE n=1 Tax=Aliishimia ponticola TaxID=2499833 RepID=A0A4S4NF76_9RHOB|nr:AAA family ATPase [Aliishimia ponticola]THH37237.1 pilus assembly protein CpaE [Aliishimia ponticola]
MSSVMPQPELAPIVACTVCRDVQNFDLLIEDMEAALGESWGDLGFAEALAFFGQPEAESLEFIALAIDSEDEENLVMLTEIVNQAVIRDIAVILIAEDVSPPTLHALMRQSNGEFVPYPLPENELAEAIARTKQKNDPKVAAGADNSPRLDSNADKQGAVFAVHGLAGGVGATTLAVNLAWELANISKEAAPSVCLLDLDMQFGSVSTYLDLPRREAVYEMLSETETMDDEVFGQALLSFEDTLSVLTSPADMLPLEMISPEDISRLIAMARAHFDYVIIDMPSTLVHWTETVLTESHVYFCPIELDMRCAQNTLRFKRALQSEELPVEKLRYVMNRAPKFTDLSGKSRVKRMAESLDISIDLLLPDGGKPVLQAADHGLPLVTQAAKNPLRKEIAKLALQIHELQETAAKAA